LICIGDIFKKKFAKSRASHSKNGNGLCGKNYLLHLDLNYYCH
jgi:hypothetical protein